ncbi:SMI1/KNR4 family protein [Actinophytocola sediminis]
MIESMRALADALVEVGLATEGSVLGCTPAQLSEFRQARGIAELPAQYAEFLTVMGREAGELLRGTDFFYPAILNVGEWGQEIVDENGIERLVAPGSLTLGTHQGYVLYWMEPGQPSGPVHRYVEGAEAIAQTWPSLLDFLVAEQARVRQVLGR